MDGVRASGPQMGGCRFDGRQFRVVDCAWRGTFGALDLLGYCEEGLASQFLDGDSCHGGIIWR